MKARDLNQLGIPNGPSIGKAFRAIERARAAGMELEVISETIRRIAAAPDAYSADDLFGSLAQSLVQRPRAFVPRTEPAPCKVWGRGIDEDALTQMRHVSSLPVAVRGALMPDAHRGYGLPIGGVLATEEAVIPYAVGMDIACRMKLSVLYLPVAALATDRGRLREALERETRFGVGASFSERRLHPVMDEDWTVSPVTRRLKDKAWAQLGSSGSGNHFVELGELTVLAPVLGLEPGTYLALLSHSGSRGTGGDVATHYSRLAQELHPELPRELAHLAWLDLAGEAGQEYWAAMGLMGRYAAASHELIHRHVRGALGCELLADAEYRMSCGRRRPRSHGPRGCIVSALLATRSRPAILCRSNKTPFQLPTLGGLDGSRTWRRSRCVSARDCARVRVPCQEKALTAGPGGRRPAPGPRSSDPTNAQHAARMTQHVAPFLFSALDRPRHRPLRRLWQRFLQARPPSRLGPFALSRPGSGRFLDRRHASHRQRLGS